MIPGNTAPKCEVKKCEIETVPNASDDQIARVDGILFVGHGKIHAAIDKALGFEPTRKLRAPKAAE